LELIICSFFAGKKSDSIRFIEEFFYFSCEKISLDIWVGDGAAYNFNCDWIGADISNFVSESSTEESLVCPEHQNIYCTNANIFIFIFTL
jgi:hypothetical protein